MTHIKNVSIVMTVIATLFATSTTNTGKKEIKKKYVTPQELSNDSFNLAKKIFNNNEKFTPTALITLWRGGAPIGIIISEYFRRQNKHIAKDIPITVSAYNHDKLKKKVHVGNLSHIKEVLNSKDKLLIVDDIIDSGSSIIALLNAIKKQCDKNTPKDIRIASIYYKPEGLKNIPHKTYCMHQAKQWIVFPHELEGLSKKEIIENKSEAIANAVLN